MLLRLKMLMNCKLMSVNVRQVTFPQMRGPLPNKKASFSSQFVMSPTRVLLAVISRGHLNYIEFDVSGLLQAVDVAQ